MTTKPLCPGGKSWQASDNAVTPRLGVTYDLTDTLAVYADTARSSNT